MPGQDASKSRSWNLLQEPWTVAGPLTAIHLPGKAHFLFWSGFMGVHIWPDVSSFGACHCLELALLFGNWERWKGTGMLGNTAREQREQKGREVQKKWISFIFPDTLSA